MSVRRGNALKPALILFSLAIGIYAAVSGLEPPPARPESAPPGEFSAARAMRYVETLAAKPHPVGTVAHDEVLVEVVGLWKSLGFEPEVQTAVLVDEKRTTAVTVSNVLARLKGTEAGKAVMFVAHYDSVPSSPGAADDAAGVAALLETARALKAGPAPKHDIVFLVTDAEETGLFGARAFVGQHPWAADVGLAVNFEARGSRGPSVMFETSAGNAPLVRAFAASAPRPQATSFAVTIYRRMPNGTDLSVFMDAGMQGLNFAFIGEPRDYHTPGDTPAHLDARSLQHHGSSALALARHFGEAGIPQKGSSDAVYFNAPGAGLVVYSSQAALIAAALAILLLAAAGIAGFRRGFLAPRKVLRSGVFVLLVLVLCPVAGVLFAKIIGRAHGAWLPAGEPGSNPSYFAALLFLAAVLFFVLYGLFRRKAGWQSLAFAATSFGAILTAALGVTIPGASYITGWPSLLGAAVLLGLFLFRTDRLDSAGGTAAVALCSFVTGVIFAGLLPFLFIALGFAPMGTGGLGVFMALAFLGIIPAIEVLARKGTAAWILLMLLAFAASTVIGAATTRYSARHPKPSTMGYLLDLDRERAGIPAADHARRSMDPRPKDLGPPAEAAAPVSRRTGRAS